MADSEKAHDLPATGSLEDVSTANRSPQQTKRTENVDVINGDAVDITPGKDGGVTKQMIRFGTGEEIPSHGDRVHVAYTGFYPVGNELKPFTSIGEKRQFSLGKGMIVRGLDLGISTMKRNEQAFFIIHPSYAYGSFGNPPFIPPHCVLFFEVELLDWKMEDLSPKKDDGILRKVLQRGEGIYPNEGATVKVEIVGYYDDRKFEDREIEFVLGEGISHGIPEGIEIALLKFKLHEKSVLYLKPPYLLGLEEKPSDCIPSETVLKYEVTLLSVTKAKDVWDMNSDEKYDKSLEAKEKGTRFFKKGSFKAALKQFQRIVFYLEDDPGATPSTEEQRTSLLVSAYINVALCHKKMTEHIDAIKACDKVLSKDPKHEKALFCRGQCRMEINDCEDALQDFMNLQMINPANSACKKCIFLCKAKMKKQKQRDKELYNNMFQKFLEQDEEVRKRRQMQMETGTWDDEEKET